MYVWTNEHYSVLSASTLVYVTSAFNCLYSFCQKLYTLLQFTQNRIATRRVAMLHVHVTTLSLLSYLPLSLLSYLPLSLLSYLPLSLPPSLSSTLSPSYTPSLPHSLSLSHPPSLVPCPFFNFLCPRVYECASQPTSLHSCWLNIEVRRVDGDDKRGQWWSRLVNILTVYPSEQRCILTQE